MSREFEDKLVTSLCWRGIKQLFIPSSVRTLITVARSVPYIKAGLNCLIHKKVQVPVLDATAISVSMLRKDFKTASSIMFLLGIGDILDEWTHKKSVADLAQTMSLNVDKVWKETDAGSVLVPVADVQVGDRIVIHTGNVSRLTAKSSPVRRWSIRRPSRASRWQSAERKAAMSTPAPSSKRATAPFVWKRAPAAAATIVSSA